MLVSMTKKEGKRIQEAGEDLDAAQLDDGGLDSKHEAAEQHLGVPGLHLHLYKQYICTSGGYS